MKTNAISRLDPQTVRARLDDFEADGTFNNDGSVVKGTLGSLSQEEMAYRIWRQVQEFHLKEPKLREMWKTARAGFGFRD